MGDPGLSGAVLLTGATGFLGTQIARRLLAETDLAVIALVRADSREAALQRASRAWWDWPELVHEIGGRIQVLRGDVAEACLGLAGAEYVEAVRRVTHIIHAAADLRLDGPLDELRRTNVEGTAHVLALARTVHRDHGLERLAHVSTAYVAGRRQGFVPEDALTDAHGFLNAYERTKYEGELLVQAARADLPVSVFRPGMVVGDSRTGAIKAFNTLYSLLRLYLSGRLRIVPASQALRLNLIPVDYVAGAIVRLTFMPGAKGLTFHLTAPPESLPTAGELVRFCRGWAREKLNLSLPRPLFIPLPAPVCRWLGAARHPGKGSLRVLAPLAPYFHERRRFGRARVDLLFGTYELQWRDFMPRLLAHAVEAGFLHRSERTVHEQLLFRLGSKSLPVTFHDIVEGRTSTRGTAAIRQDILAAAAALRSLGVRPGERVALVGLNSTRYLTLDVAIGLVGAASVPLYYTSPPAEIEAILEDSGAKLLFIGTPLLLGRLGELTVDIPVISFCRGGLPDGLPRKVMPWPEFLALGTEASEAAAAPVGFGDTATLRYTSGTTGRPKGVIFGHASLRWMAETLASILPYRTRRKRAAYLSCLPMNHVVEGILAAYSPYYFPAPVDIYFLEEIRELPRALPAVRPAVFFSVPRIYEKIWEAFASSKPGRWYLHARPASKRLLRPLLRALLLRKAGLDRCAQLIVGSAPPGESLLHSFRDLGIELHNAYGLTEAPLISLNRLGANRLGTAGVPLPLTEVRVAEDGELMVRGPQVTSGYFGQDIEQPFRDGWLLTGDLGYLTPEGDLVLQGRKKELMITAYGKNIHPLRIETLLREVPAIREAMVIGDGRPYCTALLWVDSERPGLDREELKAIDRGVVEANTRLSGPEQVKRWAVLPYSLSTGGGELTANLKLKRQVVAERYAGVIAALYGEATPATEAVHFGSTQTERSGR